MFAVDASTWDRCDAETSPERGFYYSASKHSAGQPIVAGWSYQWISQLDLAPDSWAAPARHLPHPTTRPTAPRPPLTRSAASSDDLDNPTELPLFVFDAGYDPIAIGHELADSPVRSCAASATTACSTADPPRTEPAAKPGDGHPATAPASSAPTRHLGPTRLTTHHQRPPLRHHHRHRLARTPPHASAAAATGPTTEPPIVSGTIIRVEVEHLPKPTSRTKKTLWLWWSGPDRPDLDSCCARLPPPLRHRAHLPVREEHPRLDHTIGLHPRTSRPLDLAHRRRLTQLRLARHLVDDLRLPWERPRKPTHLTRTASGEGFERLRAHSAHQPTHQNPPEQDQDAPKAPEPAPDHATQPSRRQPDQPLQGLTASWRGSGVCLPSACRGSWLGESAEELPAVGGPYEAFGDGGVGQFHRCALSVISNAVFVLASSDSSLAFFARNFSSSISSAARRFFDFAPGPAGRRLRPACATPRGATD